MKRFWILLLLIPFICKADLIVEGEVDKSIAIVNMDAFPEYDFFISYYTYIYNRGYRPDKLVTLKMESGKSYRPSRGGEATITAVHKTTGDTIVAQQKVGGTAHGQSRSVTEVIDNVEILNIGKDNITFKISSTDLVMRNGTVKKGSLPYWGGLVAISISLFSSALLYWFIKRRKQTEKAYPHLNKPSNANGVS